MQTCDGPGRHVLPTCIMLHRVLLFRPRCSSTTRSLSSLFPAAVPAAPPDPILSLTDMFLQVRQAWSGREQSPHFARGRNCVASPLRVEPLRCCDVHHRSCSTAQDKFEKKVNVGVGAYRDDAGKVRVRLGPATTGAQWKPRARLCRSPCVIDASVDAPVVCSCGCYHRFRLPSHAFHRGSRRRDWSTRPLRVSAGAPLRYRTPECAPAPAPVAAVVSCFRTSPRTCSHDCMGCVAPDPCRHGDGCGIVSGGGWA